MPAKQEVVRCRSIIMSVSLQTFDQFLTLIPQCLHLGHNGTVYWHLIVTDHDSTMDLDLYHLCPTMLPNVMDGVTQLWVSVQDFRN
jgi:hypothetical protein